MRTIRWRLYLKSDARTVFELLTTAAGRKKFWAEEADEEHGVIHFLFPNGQTYESRILKLVPNSLFHLDYFDSLVKIQLETTEDGGTDLTLINENVADSEYAEVNAGWVSVLMNLKAAADNHCDLRNHKPDRTWDQGYADN